MSDVEQLLKEIGLTSTEATIYLTGLHNESVDVRGIAVKTKIKRPTIYHALNTLLEKGLVAERKIGNRVQFSMCSPTQLKAHIQRQKERLSEQENKLNTLIPLLEQSVGETTKDPHTIVEYKGVEGVKMVLDVAFYCRSKHWDIIAPVDNFLKQYDKQYADYYLRARKYNVITSRSLWEDGFGGRKLTKEEVADRNPRFMPKSMQGKFHSMIILFDDKVAIISPLEKLSATLITSKEIHGMLSAMFNSIWEVATKYK
jgi:sugar-specific transcriptional regulator TrmB